MARIIPNKAGIRTILKSGEIRAALMEIIEPIATTATGMAESNENSHTRGAEYKAYVDEATNLLVGKVVCGNAAARHDNSHNNTLLKARW